MRLPNNKVCEMMHKFTEIIQLVCTKLAHLMKFCHFPGKSHIKHDAYRFRPVVQSGEDTLKQN